MCKAKANTSDYRITDLQHEIIRDLDQYILIYICQGSYDQLKEHEHIFNYILHFLHTLILQ